MYIYKQMGHRQISAVPLYWKVGEKTKIEVSFPIIFHKTVRIMCRHLFTEINDSSTYFLSAIDNYITLAKRQSGINLFS